MTFAILSHLLVLMAFCNIGSAFFILIFDKADKEFNKISDLMASK